MIKEMTNISDVFYGFITFMDISKGAMLMSVTVSIVTILIFIVAMDTDDCITIREAAAGISFYAMLSSIVSIIYMFICYIIS